MLGLGHLRQSQQSQTDQGHEPQLRERKPSPTGGESEPDFGNRCHEHPIFRANVVERRDWIEKIPYSSM
jgi:hypothetical protein